VARLDLNGIRNGIGTLLTNNNTTTSSVVDLSNALAGNVRVEQIFKLNPLKIPPQASLFPCITIYPDAQTPLADTIARNAANGSQKNKIVFKITPLIWNQNFVSIDEDPADEDIGELVENIKEILRSDTTLGGTATWSQPVGVSYYDFPLDEETHLRAAVIDYQVTVFH